MMIEIGANYSFTLIIVMVIFYFICRDYGKGNRSVSKE